MSVHI